VNRLLPSPAVTSIDDYLERRDGGIGLATAQDIGPAATLELVEASGLRGRGGGGFPTGRKWRTVAEQPGPRHVVINAAEGEPGTFKDRALIRADPYQLVEGALIAALTVNAETVHIALKRSFTEERAALLRAVTEMQDAGICRDCPIVLVEGPADYLFGEETGLLEVIEGRAARPRLFPPYLHGLFAGDIQTGWEGSDPPSTGAHPTVVNNAETIAHVSHILREGADWFRSVGTPTTPGTTIATVVGQVVRPGCAEFPMGTPLSEVIEVAGGGVAPGRSVKAVASGVANPVLPGEAIDAPLGFDELTAAGGGLGSAGFIVLDDTACMVEAARIFSAFLARESCGQCPMCINGSAEITERLVRLEAGEPRRDDLEELDAWLDKVTDGNRCFLAVEEQLVVRSILARFPDEVAAHAAGHTCRHADGVALWQIAGLDDDGTFRLTDAG
jgi:NADH:ubiquinone oxidoreductase subunit F (NADH-binding)